MTRATLSPLTLALPSAALDKRLYAPTKIVAVVSTLSDMGIPADRVLEGTGLTTAALDDAATLTSVRQFLTVCRSARYLCDDPALAFRIGERLRVSSNGMYGYALMCAPTMRHAYDVALRYHMLATPVMPIHWRDDRATLAWVFPEALTLHGSELPPPFARFPLELQVAIHVTLHKDVMGTDCLPSHAKVTGPPPPHAKVYEVHLQCPVAFGQRCNELHYAATWLDRAPQQANPITAAALLQTCTTLLAESRRATGVAGQVYRALAEHPGHFPDVEAIAAQLHTTSRTLRRKLDAEGTSYQRLLADVRRSLAIDYLRDTSLTTEDIAEALGFSDGASFRHAFRRWTMKSPSEYRRQA